MKLIRESVELKDQSGNDLNKLHQELYAKHVEWAGRVCYQSSHKVKDGSCYTFVRNMLASGHLSTIEHVSVSAKIVTNRAVSLECVRHRLGSYSQESTRYCNYSGDRFGRELVFIIPTWVTDEELSRHFPDEMFDIGYMNDPTYVWCCQMQSCEDEYFCLLQIGWTPEKAREVLPNSLKTTLVATYNLRTWRHVLEQRLDRKCHPEMRYTMSLIGQEMLNKLPLFFEDIITQELLDDASGNRL